MKRKIITAIAAVTLIISLVSCDAVVNIMGKMGGNIAGVDTKRVDEAVDSVTVSEDAKASEDVAADGEKKVGGVTVTQGAKFTDGSGNELYSIGKTGEDKKYVIGVGNTSLTVELTDDESDKYLVNALEKLSEPGSSVLPVQDLSSVVTALDGAEKETLEKLSQSVDGKTKTAAEGTQAVVAVVLSEAKDFLGEYDKGESKQTTEALKVVDQILKNISESQNNESEKKMTLGDVVVLQSLTNVMCKSGKSIISMISGSSSSGSGEGESTGTEESETEESGTSATGKVISDAYTEIYQMASVLATVSSSTTIFEGIDLTSVLDVIFAK